MSEITAEIVKCDMPQAITLELCKNCKRAEPPKEDEEVETFVPRKKMFGTWECDGYINKDQGSLF